MWCLMWKSYINFNVSGVFVFSSRLICFTAKFIFTPRVVQLRENVVYNTKSHPSSSALTKKRDLHSAECKICCLYEPSCSSLSICCYNTQHFREKFILDVTKKRKPFILKSISRFGANQKSKIYTHLNVI